MVKYKQLYFTFDSMIIPTAALVQRDGKVRPAAVVSFSQDTGGLYEPVTMSAMLPQHRGNG